MRGKGEVRLGQDSLPKIVISVAETIYVVLPGPHVWFYFSKLDEMNV